MALTQEQEEARALDRPSTDGEITRLDYEDEKVWSISCGYSGFWLSHENLGEADPPQLGNRVALYTTLGSTVRGIDLRGEPVFYKLQEELDADHEKWKENFNREKREKFEQDREELDAQFASFPEVFQRRISWFRDHNPDFRWEFESYESMVCVDAIKIAEALETVGAVKEFQAASWEEQQEMVPDVSKDHSGNSFGMAVRLAALYVRDPILVITEHGALAPLVGCEDYGCAHPRPDDVMKATERVIEEIGDGE